MQDPRPSGGTHFTPFTSLYFVYFTSLVYVTSLHFVYFPALVYITSLHLVSFTSFHLVYFTSLHYTSLGQVILLSNFSVNNNYSHFLHALLRLFCALIDAGLLVLEGAEKQGARGGDTQQGGVVRAGNITLWIDNNLQVSLLSLLSLLTLISIAPIFPYAPHTCVSWEGARRPG